MIKPHSKGECKRLLIQTQPKFDHEYGYFKETVEEFIKKWGMNSTKFWKVWGVNTCMLDNKTGKVVYYWDDIERATREYFNNKWVDSGEWD